MKGTATQPRGAGGETDCSPRRKYPRRNKAALAAFREAGEELDRVRRTVTGNRKSCAAGDLGQIWKDLES